MVDFAIPPDVKLGCNRRITRVGSIAGVPALRSVLDVIPRTGWEALLGISLVPHVKIVHYQDGEGSCAANSSVSAGVEIPRSIAGLPFVHMAPSSLYKNSGGRRDEGSGLDENLKFLRDPGCVPVSMWGGELGYNKPWPPGFEAEAAKFQVDEWFDISTFGEFMTALFLGFPISYGVFWKDSSGREGGHAICAVEPIFERGVWGCVFLNSWGANWGDGGFEKMWEPQIARGINYFGGFAPRVGTYSMGG